MSGHGGPALVAVLEERRRLVMREMALPDLGPDDGLLAVETNGICGSDAEFYDGALVGYPLPMTLGHEPVGRVVALGRVARERWGVEEGDRVVVNSALRCGRCSECDAGRDCRTASYGTLSPDRPPGLWGGIATHLYLAPGATLVPLAESVSTAAAAFHNPLANGFEWVDVAGGVSPGGRVVVLGAGPRAFACALVALHLGAEDVAMVGLERDRSRLELARELGVRRGVVVESDRAEELRDRLGPVDVAVDTTPYSTVAATQALHALDAGGRLVLAGLKGDGRTLELEVDLLIRRRLSVVAPPSKSERSLRRAVRALELGTMPVDRITARAYPLAQAALAIEALSSEDPDRPLQLRVEPGL